MPCQEGVDGANGANDGGAEQGRREAEAVERAAKRLATGRSEAVPAALRSDAVIRGVNEVDTRQTRHFAERSERRSHPPGVPPNQRRRTKRRLEVQTTVGGQNDRSPGGAEPKRRDSG